VNVIETRGLGKCYGRTRALRECTLAIPAGHVAALVGSNGAGKTTLLNLAVSLNAIRLRAHLTRFQHADQGVCARRSG
jgi:ABC-type multidrug transport system ATPase subunit